MTNIKSFKGFIISVAKKTYNNWSLLLNCSMNSNLSTWSQDSTTFKGSFPVHFFSLWHLQTWTICVFHLIWLKGSTQQMLTQQQHAVYVRLCRPDNIFTARLWYIEQQVALGGKKKNSFYVPLWNQLHSLSTACKFRMNLFALSVIPLPAAVSQTCVASSQPRRHADIFLRVSFWSWYKNRALNYCWF